MRTRTIALPKSTRWAMLLLMVLSSVLVIHPAQAATARDFSVVAHRGDHAATTENSIQALDLAALNGATTMETDLHLTKDGYFAVMHDNTLARTTNCTGYVHSRTRYDLRHNCRLDNGEVVPFVNGLLHRAHARGLNVILEIKDDQLDRWTVSKITTLMELVSTNGMTDRTMYLSFDDAVLRRVEAASPANDTTYIYDGTLATVPEMEAMGVDNASVAAWAVTHAAGHAVYGRNTAASTDWQTFADAGVDGVLTDDLSGYVAWRSPTPSE